MALTPWWDLFPGRLEYEVDKLEKAGIVVTIDPQSRDDRNVIVMHLDVPAELTGQGRLNLQAVFPFFYPVAPPKVVILDSDFEMPHHLNPFTKEVCLLATPGEDWETTHTLAGLLEQQLPEALRAGMASSGDEGPWNEEPQAEPYGAYYSYAEPSTILVDGSWEIPTDEGYGSIRFALSLPDESQPNLPVIGALLSVESGQTGRLLAELPTELVPIITRASHGSIEERFGRWSRFARPLAVQDAKLLWEAAEEADENPEASARLAHETIQVRAVVYPEETSQRTSSDGWLFIVKSLPMTRGLNRKDRRHLNPEVIQAQAKYFLVRPGRAGPDDLAARTPELRGLGSKKVMLFGAGALGSAVGVHLARAGLGELQVVDPDIIEPGNLVRHAATTSAVGVRKAVALKDLATGANPYIKVQSHIFGIGVADISAVPQVDPILGLEGLAGTDLIIDATADRSVQRALAHVARSLNLPYVYLEATNGAWGGLVALIDAHSPWCKACLEYHQTDGTIPGSPASPERFVQPVGCSQPTFTGSSFDLEEVSLQAVRTVVGRLSRDDPHGYPESASDIHVLAIRDVDGASGPPNWTGYRGDRHRACGNHS